MQDVVVAVDIETTGLDPRRHSIIEIGAIKFQGDRVLDKWARLVDPGIPIPPLITQLTGITDTGQGDRDVQGKPRIAAVIPDLRRFIGTAPILGHSIHFDLEFLNAAGARLSNPLIDTYSLASVLLPAAPRYNLGALAMLLGVGGGKAHQALDDAAMTVSVYQHLLARIHDLPLDTLAEIVRLGRQTPWDGASVFEQVMRARTREVAHPAGQREDIDAELVGLFADLDQGERELRPSPTVRPVDIDRLAASVQPGGEVAAALPGYEHRSEQVEMLRHVARALNEGRHMLIEAPTGVGKSLAYLAPSIRFAQANNDRIVISTNTINLQEQLIDKDIPLLQKAAGGSFRAAVLKGRSNYLCPRRLAALRRRGATTPAEMQLLAKLLVWLTTDHSGDRNRITLRGPAEMGIWNRLSAEDEGCTGERCATQMGGVCPFYQAKRRAEAAHLLIVNHALLLSDAASEGRVLPEYKYLIIDEAHHLEDAVTSSMSFRTDPQSIERQLADLGTQTSGLLGELLRETRAALPEGYFHSVRDYVDMVVAAASAMTHHVNAFFDVLQRFVRNHVQLAGSEYTQSVRILDPLRRQPEWSEVEVHWDNLSHFTGGVAEAMAKLADGLADLQEYDIEDFDDLLAGTRAAARHLTELHERLGELVSQPDSNMVYWVDLTPDGGRISAHTAPLDIGPLVQKHIWYSKEAVVLTSATMRTDGSFDFIRAQLDADEAEEVVIGSPFDYEKSTLLYVANDIPEPADKARYQQAVEQGILDLCLATQGRALILFTSYAQLRQTTSAISDQLLQAGITVYDQSEGTSRSSLLEGFIETDKAVLMGTRSFWEGVDVPGSDLSVLVIVRLPFSVPSDPLFAARSELFEDSFNQYALPETILRFRQGFGRLIRRKTDRGVVAIFDRRVISKGYGRMFIDSLPRCTLRRGRLADLPRAAAEWLESDV